MIRVVKLLLIFLSVCIAHELSDEEIYRLPKLFHLDDYDRCLSQKDGVYCLGTFELAPQTKPNPVYDVITDQLKHHFSFDRRLLHRGYCISKRCQSPELNTTYRFEQCVDRPLRKYALTARLQKLSYCSTHAERVAKLSEKPDLPQRVFLYVVYLILFFNVIGSVHDMYSIGKKNKHLLAWSIPANWRALTTVDDGASLFAPVQSSKIILHCIIIYTHANLLHFMAYVQNPETLEKSGNSFVNVLIRNGTSLVQVFILISSFFTGYNVLETVRKSTVDTWLAAKWILKRIFRLAPVYLLLTAYSATWWPRNGDGPLWSLIVEAESKVCRNKFWTHLLFINNFVEPSELCMVQSWAIAAEVQLFLVSMLLTLLLNKLKVRAVPILGAMFAASCLFNITLAYAAGLVPMVKIIVPETLRNAFRGSKSFFHLHTSPWSNLPACFFGLLVAHIYFEQKYKIKAKIEDNKETSNRNICNEVKQENGRLVNENDRIVNENGILVKEKGILVNGNGALENGNDTLSNKNIVRNDGNGILVNGNGALINRNGALVNGNGTLLNRNGALLNGNSILVNGNGAILNRNGALVNGNGTLQNGNGTLVNGNITLVNRSGILSNGHTTLSNGNGTLMNKNDIHSNGNGMHIKVNGGFKNGNDVQIKHNGVNTENGIRNRKYMGDDNKDKYTTSPDYEKKRNVDPNGDINQNGLSKLDGYGNQNGISLEIKDKKIKKKAPFLLRYAHCFTLPILILWLVFGSRVTGIDSAPATALYVGLERLIFSVVFACQLLQIITVKGPWATLLSWRGWTVPARLVLSVAMVHWCVNATLLAARPQPVVSSILYVSIDWLATMFYSYVIALPLCILVELPMKKALDAILS